MKIKICDLCGDVLDDYKILSKRYKVKIKMIYEREGYLRTKKYDLCEKCMRNITEKICEKSEEVSECSEENNAE